MDDKITNHDERVRIINKFRAQGILPNVKQLIQRFAFRYGEDSITVEFCHALLAFISDKLLEGHTSEIKEYIFFGLTPGECEHFYYRQGGFHHIKIEVLVLGFVSFRCEIIWEILEFQKCDPGISNGNWMFEFVQFDLISYKEFLPKIVEQKIRSRERQAAEFSERALYLEEQEKTFTEWRVSKFESEWFYWFCRKYDKSKVNGEFFKFLRGKIKRTLISQFCEGKSEEYKKYIQRHMQLASPNIKDIFPLPYFPDKLVIPFKMTPYGPYAVKANLILSSYKKDKMDLLIINNAENEMYIEIIVIETSKIDSLFEEWDTYWRVGKIPGLGDLLNPYKESN
jgi:hypothetical protein